MDPAKLPKAKVLIVDDKHSNLVALASLLEPDHDVQFASSGAEAIELVKRQPDVDVILMDVQMPGLDGFETAVEIKKLEAGKDIPIIFVTAVYGEDPSVKKGFQSGGVDYFSKPFDPEVLRMKIGIYASFNLRLKLLKERERHVRESEELLRVGRKLSSALESLPVGVMIADVDGRICQTTEQVARILRSNDAADNGAYGEILGWWDHAGKRMKQGSGPLARAIRRGETSHSEPIDIRCVDGSAKTILASAAPLRGHDDRLVGAVVLIQDLTETKQIEQALAERVTHLVQSALGEARQ